MAELNATQLSHFRAFGFLILSGLFKQEELRTIEFEFEKGLSAAYAHDPFNATYRHWATLMGPDTPFFSQLLEDPRFCGAAEELFGQDVLGVGVCGNRHVRDKPWHIDTRSPRCYGVKFAFYLDPLTSETGALRVMPGSHHRPFHDEVGELLREGNSDAHMLPAFVFECSPGDVIAFDLRLWHASLGGTAGRRMCELIFYRNPKCAADEESVREQAAANLRHLGEFNRPMDPLYHPHWLANTDKSSRRQHWVERMRELGFFETNPHCPEETR